MTSRSDKPTDTASPEPDRRARKAEESGSIAGEDWSIDIDFDDEDLFDEAPPPAPTLARGVHSTQEIEILEELDEYEAIEIAPGEVIVHSAVDGPDSGKPPPPIPDLDEAPSGPGFDPAFDETLPPHLLDVSDPPLLGGSAAAPRSSRRPVKLEIPGVELLGLGATSPRFPAMDALAPTGARRAFDDEATVPLARLPDITDTVPDEARLDLTSGHEGAGSDAAAELERALELELEAAGERGGDELLHGPLTRLRTGTTAPYKTVGAVLSGAPVFNPGLLAPPRDQGAVDETQRAMRPLSFAVEPSSGDLPAVPDTQPAAVRAKAKAPAGASSQPGAPVGTPPGVVEDLDIPFDPESISGVPLPAPLVREVGSELGTPPSQHDANSKTNVGFQVLAPDESAPGRGPKLPPLRLGFPPIKTQIGQRAAEVTLYAEALARGRAESKLDDPKPAEPEGPPADAAFDFDDLHQDEGVSLTAELDAAIGGARHATAPPDRPSEVADDGPPTRPVRRQARVASSPSPPRLFDTPPPIPPRPGVATKPPLPVSSVPPSPKIEVPAPSRAPLPSTPGVPLTVTPPVPASPSEHEEPTVDFSDPKREPTRPRLQRPTPRLHVQAPPDAPAPPRPSILGASPRRAELPPPPAAAPLGDLPLPPQARVPVPVVTSGLRELPPEANDLEDVEPLAGVRFLTDSLTFEDEGTDSAELELVPLSDYEPYRDFGEERLLAGLQQPVGLDSRDLPGIPRNPFEREGTPVFSGGVLPDEAFTEDHLPELEPLRPLSEQVEAVEALSGEHTPLPATVLVPGALVPALRDYLEALLEARPGPGGPGWPETRAANAKLGVPADVLLTARLSEYGGHSADGVRVVASSAPLARALIQGLMDWPERPTVVLGLTGSGKSHTLNRLASALATRHLGLEELGNAYDDELDPLAEDGALPLPIVIDTAELATRSFGDGEAFLRALVEGHHLPAELLNYRGPAIVLADRVDVALSLGAQNFDPLYLLRTLLHARPAWRAAIATRPLSDAVFLNWGNLHGPFPVVEVAGMRAPQTRGLVQGWAEVARPRPKDPAALARLLPSEISSSPRLLQLLLGQWLTAATEIEGAAIRGGGSSLARLILDGVCTQTEVKLGTKNTRQDLQILADTLGGLGSTHLLLEDVQALLDEGYLRDDLDTLQSTGVIEVQVVRGDASVGGVTFTHSLFQEVLLAEYLEHEVIQLGMRGELDRLVDELQPVTQLAPYALSQVRRLIEVADLLIDSLASHLRPDLTESVGTWLWQQLNGDVFPESPHYPRLVSVAWIIVSRNNTLDGSHHQAMNQLKINCGPTLVGLLTEANEIALSEAIEAL